MRSRLLLILALAGAFATLAGCSNYEHRERPPWRAEAERVCLAKGLVRESVVVRSSPGMEGPGICGVTHPFKVTALADGSVTLNATQTLDCPMIAALDQWLRDVVQPAARARFGEPVVGINSMGSYSCRGINNMSGASLSEHAFANAIDVGGFVLASGRELDVRRGFNGADEQERAFLHEAHAGACQYFTTVLGPGYNIFHYNHFHLDLAMHGMTARGPRRYCKPVPQTGLPEPPIKDSLPDPPPIEEEMDEARTPIPAPALRGGPPTLVADVPPPVPTRIAASPRPVAVGEPPRDPAVPARAPAAAPPVARDDAPLISFAEPEPSQPRSIAGPVPAPRPGRRSEPAPAPMEPDPPQPDAAATSPETVPRRAPAATEGSPRDWDVTSSVGH